MGDFNEHLLFGLLFASIFGYFLKDSLVLEPANAFIAALAVVIGSLLPDIDHENSYIRRSAKSFSSLSAGIATFYFFPGPVHYRFFVAVVSLLMIYGGFSYIKIRHRGVTHSLWFGVTFSSIIVAASSLLMSSALPGIALGLGIFSHLLLDGELKFS